MNYFNFKRRNLFSGPHLLGLLLIFAGFVALVSPLIFSNESSLERILAVGGGAITLGIVIVSSYGGTLIDFKKNRLKEYNSIGGYKFGEWTKMPVISSVKVISTSYISTNTPNGISPTLSGNLTDFKIQIFSNPSKPLLSFVYTNREKAVKCAKGLASNLNADLVLTIAE